MTVALLCLLLALPAAAWETDQLTDRTAPLPDLTDPANRHLQQLIDEAIARTNERTRCEGDDDKLHATLARVLHRSVGRAERVQGRGWIRGMGYNRYGAWLEQQPEVRSFVERDDIFNQLGLFQAPVLHLAGACATVSLAGQRVGVDKVDHFLGMGFYYWKRSRKGARPDRALAWGARTERSIFGMMTSSAFSHADLVANHDGYRFYLGLLDPGGVAARGADGCLKPTSPFDWADWIDWRYDEVLNPSVYTRPALRGIDRALTARQDALCAEFADWAEPDFQDHMDAVLASDPDVAAGRAPDRVDPFHLSARCTDDGTVVEQEPAQPASGSVEPLD